MHLRVMRVWVAFYTLYLGLIKVLGHWSEVGTCVESSEPQLGTYVAQAILHLCSGGGLAQLAKGQMLGLLEDLPMRWVFPLLKTCFLPAPPPQILSTMARRPRSSRAWHFVLSAAHRDADARAMALAGTANWSYDSDGQVSGYYWNKVRRPPRRAFPWSSRTLLLTLGSPWLRIHMALRRQDLQTDTTLLFIYLFIYLLPPPPPPPHYSLYSALKRVAVGFFGQFIQQNLSIPSRSPFPKVTVVNSMLASRIIPLSVQLCGLYLWVCM